MAVAKGVALRCQDAFGSNSDRCPTGAAGLGVGTAELAAASGEGHRLQIVGCFLPQQIADVACDRGGEQDRVKSAGAIEGRRDGRGHCGQGDADLQGDRQEPWWLCRYEVGSNVSTCMFELI